MKRRSRLLCWLLTGLMITTSCPVTAYAEQMTQFQEEVEQEETTDVPVEKEELENSKLSASDFEINVANGTEITIKKYRGSSTEVDLSQVGWGVEGAKVVAIGNEAFKENKTIRQVVLPNTVGKIGNKAFYKCESLRSVSILGEDAQLAEIGESAFESCGALTDIELPESLVKIGKSAFKSNVALKQIVLPSNLDTMGTEIFYKCTELKSVSFSGNKITQIPEKNIYLL